MVFDWLVILASVVTAAVSGRYYLPGLGAQLAIMAAAIALSISLARVLTQAWRMPDYVSKVWLILCTVLVAATLCWVRWPFIKLGIDLRGGVNLVYELEKGREAATAKPTRRGQPVPSDTEAAVDMDQLISAISKRVNPGGQKEIAIRTYGQGQIEIIIPEADDTEVARIKDKISRAGTLEFRITANHRDNPDLIEKARALPPTEDVVYAAPTAGQAAPQRKAWWVPVFEKREKEFLSSDYVTRTVHRRAKDVLEVLVVDDPFNVTGADLWKAQQGYELARTGGPDVEFSFRTSGADRFGRLTSSHLPDKTQEFYYHLGIVLDGKIFSAPRIMSAIHERGEITGNFSMQEAKDLADVLNAGSLPAALNPVPIREYITGPTLGTETIHQGMVAIIVATVLVFAFMLVYYRFSGIVACLTVVMNLTMTVALMIFLKAAFTLPGLVGLALTVGVAVDANVLIYERMREELEKQSSLRMAIRNGFGRAWSAIFDSNLTDLITALVLYVVGEEQVRGFAVTFFLGVLLNLFTAVFCSRIIFEVAERRKWISRLRMMSILHRPKIDFYGLRHICYAVSITITVVGLAATVARGVGLLNIDFTGGVSVDAVFNQPQDAAAIQRALENDLQELTVSSAQEKGMSAGTRFVINTASPRGMEAEQYLAHVKDVLKQKFGPKLASNNLQWKLVPEGTGAPPAAGKPAAAPGDSKGAAPANSQGRNDLPAETLLASADPAAVALTAVVAGLPTVPPNLALAADPPKAGPGAAPATSPAAKAAATAKPPAEPKLVPPAKKVVAPPKAAAPPAAPPAAAATQKTPAPAAPAKPQGATAAADWTKARFDFAQKVDHTAVEDAIRAALASGKYGRKETAFRVNNPQYELGSSERFSDWDVEADLPRPQAEGLFAAVEADVRNTPFFPASNTIGGRVAESTRVHAVYAIVISNVLIMIYLWIRFQRLMYGAAAVIALVHDVLVVLGFVAASQWLSRIPGFQGVLLIDSFKIGMTEVAAFLTLVGYSVHDTVVVFDRIREVKGKLPILTPEIMNASINQVFARSLLTSLTVLLVVVAVYVLGGATMHGFAYAMVVAVITGTYSSIYVAAPLLFLAQSGSKAKQFNSRRPTPVGD
jgi:SecD/SecF fusion protein